MASDILPVFICGSGSSCLSKIIQLHDTTTIPILVLVDMPFDEEQKMKRLSREPRTPSPTSTRRPAPDSTELEDIYGMHFLLHVNSEIQQHTLSKLVVPVAVLSGYQHESIGHHLSLADAHGAAPPMDSLRIIRYLEAGAVDVYTSPLSKNHIHALAVHAYRVHREASREDSGFLASKRNRKLSWVGVDQAKPYAYLREAMVSGLMGKICNPEYLSETHDPK
jgi:hypothetical protein